jgi:hypothetical protein
MSGVLGFSMKKLLGGAYFLAVVLSVTLCVCVSTLVNLFQRSSHLAAATIAAAATAAAEC